MNFTDLEYFLAVVEEGGFIAASRRLFVSQQTISEHIKKLETEYNTVFFSRNKPLELTPSGQVFCLAARDMMAIKKGLKQAIDNVSDGAKKQLNLGIATYDTPEFLTKVLVDYEEIHPECNVSIYKRRTLDIAYGGMTGIDFYFSYLPLDAKLNHYIVAEDRMAVIIPNSLFAKVYGDKAGEIRLSLQNTGDLSVVREMPFILLYDRTAQLSLDLSCVFSDFNFFPQNTIKTENRELNFQMCLAGKGCFVAPYYTCRAKLNSQKAANVSDFTIYNLNTNSVDAKIAISYERTRKLSKLDEDFLKTAKKSITDWITSF